MLLSTSSKNIKLGIFLKPFANETWYVNVVFVVFTMFIMRIIMRYEKLRASETKEETSKQEKYSNAMVVTIGIIGQQGIKVARR